VVDGPAEERAELSFGGLLRRLRDEAGLTQDELAEAAQVSQRAVSDLERGINATARKDTAVLLAGALGLDGPAGERFVAAARGKGPAAAVLTVRQQVAPGAFAALAARALPRDIAAFTGRQAELGRLMGKLAAVAAGGGVVGIHAVDGMAGIGKTTFVVHAAHQLAASFPDGQFFLPLHAHTRGQRPVAPADALASLLLIAGAPASQIPPGTDARAARWRDHLAGKKVLLVLDDAAGHEQVRPLLPGTAGSLVLVTSRRRLAALDDAAVITLDPLSPAQAAALFTRLAGRAEVSATDPAVGEIARLCGHLPLAIGMLARKLSHHRAWAASQLAAELAAARDRLAFMYAENLSVAAALNLSYRDLTGGQRRLFRRLGLVPGPSIDAHAVAALDGTSLDQARRHLEQLYDQHLLTEPVPGRYVLHDLVREHARTLAADGDPAYSAAASRRLLDYYLHTTLAASSHIPVQRITSATLPLARPPKYAPQLATQGQAWAWLEAERANLHAAVGYATATGQARHARLIPAAMAAFLQAEGYWHQGQALLQAAVAAARQDGDRPGEGQILMLLGLTQLMCSDIAGGAATFQQALALYRELGDSSGQGDALSGIGYAHQQAGHYPAAATCHRQALELLAGQPNPRGQANALNDLGTVQFVTGDYPAAAASIQQALKLFRDIGHRSGEGDALIALGTLQQLTGDYPAAAATFEQTIRLYRDIGERDGHAWAVNNRGAVSRLTGDYLAAAARHQQALSQFRDLSDRNGQANTLNNLGLVQQLTGDYSAAAASHQQALQLYRDLGRLHEQADVLNGLGELASRTAASQQARDHHSRALAIACDLGVPLEEARALEGIGRSHLHDGHTGKATALLRDALAIYQRIASPHAQRIEETLRQSGPSPASASPVHDQEPAHQRRRPPPPRSSQRGSEQQQLPADEPTQEPVRHCPHVSSRRSAT
jgi:tetratricopeptide (TPR) repeat protein/transcriptional regulator with XRE-family HTH domain